MTFALQAPSTPLTNPCAALLIAKSADTDGCPVLAHIDVERAHSVPSRKSLLIKTRDQYGTCFASLANREATETAVRDQMARCYWLHFEGICKSFVTQGISGRILKFSLPVNQICTTKELEYMA